jgi:hypothetical protein
MMAWAAAGNGRRVAPAMREKAARRRKEEGCIAALY